MIDGIAEVLDFFFQKETRYSRQIVGNPFYGSGPGGTHTKAVVDINVG